VRGGAVVESVVKVVQHGHYRNGGARGRDVREGYDVGEQNGHLLKLL